jgi:hypothetical protein
VQAEHAEAFEQQTATTAVLQVIDCCNPAAPVVG